MTVSLKGLFDLLAELCEEKKLRCTLKSSLKGGLITGVTAVIGGLLLGPVGLAIGGTVGGVAAAANSERFQSVAVVLRNMPRAQKERLYQKLLNTFSEFGPQDIAALAALIMSRESFKEIAIREVTNYLANDMALQIA